MVKSKNLNAKEELFCVEYAKSLDATGSAKKAGYRDCSAASTGHRILQKPAIQDRIRQLRENREKRTNITIDMVITELWQIANSDPGDAYDDNGKLKNIKDMPEHLRKTLQSIETYEDFTEGVAIGEIQKLKFWDKTKALDMLARHLGMYIDLTINKNLNINVTEPQSTEAFEKVKGLLTNGFQELQKIKDVTPIRIDAKPKDES
jgi:phage terminase small subunit